ncbi:MAG: Uma2 family endonuclease [Acidobacteriia bacterium]|nr:Uma2 family endonuclease [Terriglobia bacterium]
MASSSTRLLTFAEFEQLPDTQQGFRYELRHGELFKVPPPKHRHFRVQQNLRELLARAVGAAGLVATEFGFKPQPEHQYWIADVAYVSRARWDRIPENGYLEGAPDLVVEVLSGSNTAAEMLDRRNVCLENGALEFWLVDPEHRQVEVSTPDGRSITYKSGQAIPLLAAPGSHIPVDAIFQ